MTLADISPLISAVALVISLFTLWFTSLRRGAVRSTHPSFIAIRYDFIAGKAPQAKIFFRALLYSTSKRGQVIESLSLRVREGSRNVEFSFWGLGDKDLIRGSGLFAPDTGVATNHHFNPTDAETPFLFSGGLYSLELFAKLVGTESPISLWNVTIDVPAEVFGTSIAREKAIFYSWSPAKRSYIVSIENRHDSAPVLSDQHA